MPTFTLEGTVHLVQVSLTPIFLLSGIAALLNVYATRLGRVSDHLDALAGKGSEAGAVSQSTREEIRRLHRRSVALDYAVVLSTAGAASTCLAIISLFLQAIANTVIASILLVFFGFAIICTLASIGMFGIEMLVSSRAMRLRMHFHVPHLATRQGRRMLSRDGGKNAHRRLMPARRRGSANLIAGSEILATTSRPGGVQAVSCYSIFHSPSVALHQVSM